MTILDFINDCIKIAYLYFGTIQTIHGPVITKIVIPDDDNVSNVNKKPEIKKPEENSIGSDKEQFDSLMRSIDVDTASLSLIEEKVSFEPNATSVDKNQLISCKGIPTRAITAEEFERLLLIENGYIPSTEVVGLTPSLSSPDEQSQELDGYNFSVSIDSRTIVLNSYFGEWKNYNTPFTMFHVRQFAFPIEMLFIFQGETLEEFIKKHGTELSPKQAQRVTELVPKNMIAFIFNTNLLTGGQVRKHGTALYCPSTF